MSKQKLRHHNFGASAAGFSLTEVMVSVMIFSIGMVGIYGLTASLLRMNRLADDVRVSTAAAEAVVEDLLASDYASLASGSTTSGPYTVYWNVYTSAVPGSKTATIVASWRNTIGDDQQVEIRTIFGESYENGKRVNASAGLYHDRSHGVPVHLHPCHGGSPLDFHRAEQNVPGAEAVQRHATESLQLR